MSDACSVGEVVMIASSSRPIRGNALGEELTISVSGGLSEKAALERS